MACPAAGSVPSFDRSEPRWYTLRGFHSTHDVIPRSFHCADLLADLERSVTGQPPPERERLQERADFGRARERFRALQRVR